MVNQVRILSRPQKLMGERPRQRGSRPLTDFVAINQGVNAGRTTSTKWSHVENGNSSGDNTVLDCLSNLVTPINVGVIDIIRWFT